mmetsp:Transcript_119862/g.311019  ORF Transcript_119862/g.311019 Transcript_119862/m.311019 type:complete len:292 (+) Transcript_119862:2230-3105(+)
MRRHGCAHENFRVPDKNVSSSKFAASLDACGHVTCPRVQLRGGQVFHVRWQAASPLGCQIGWPHHRRISLDKLHDGQAVREAVLPDVHRLQEAAVAALPQHGAVVELRRQKRGVGLQAADVVALRAFRLEGPNQRIQLSPKGLDHRSAEQLPPAPPGTGTGSWTLVQGLWPLPCRGGLSLRPFEARLEHRPQERRRRGRRQEGQDLGPGGVRVRLHEGLRVVGHVAGEVGHREGGHVLAGLVGHAASQGGVHPRPQRGLVPVVEAAPGLVVDQGEEARGAPLAVAAALEEG